MLLKSNIIFLLITGTFSNSIIIRKENFVQKEFLKFFKKLTRCKHRTFELSTCYFTPKIPVNVKNVTDWFISQNTCVPLHFRDFDMETSLIYEIHTMFIFKDSLENLHKFVDILSRSESYKPSVTVFFFVTYRVKNKDFLNATLPYIWSKNISKFVVVFVQDKLQIFTYFPFERNKIQQTRRIGRYCQKLFEEKVKNLNGFPLRAAVFERVPYTVCINGTWTGQDITVLHHIAKELNASVEIIGTTNYHLPNGTSMYLYSNRVDVIMVRLFESFYFKNSTSSYPFGIDHKVVIVPRRKKVLHYEHFFEIFDPLGVFLINLSALCLLIVIYIFKKNDEIDFVDVFMILWASSWMVPTPYLKKFKWKFRFLLIVWIFCFIILNCNFGTALVSLLVSSRKTKPIRSLEELSRSNLSIYIAEYFLKSGYIPSRLGLNEKFIKVVQPEYLLNHANITHAAYVIRKDAAFYFCEQNLDENGDSYYDIVDESLLPGVNVYTLQKNSPFLHQFSRSILFIQQFGFATFRNYEKTRKRKAEEILPLQLKHLYLLFYVLLVGYGCALLVFFFEVVCHKYGESVSKFKNRVCFKRNPEEKPANSKPSMLKSSCLKKILKKRH